MSSSLQVPRMRAAVRRVKAGGERFLGGMLPGASARRLQIRAFADEWAAANLDAKQATGPLWIVLGDSASQGIGATTRDVGYVGVVHEMLRRRDAWRVINLSTAGAGLADVLSRQLPELAALTAEQPADLVSCLIGVEDIARRRPGLDILLRQLMAALPSGTVVGTLARGARSGPAAALDAVVREEAARHRMRIAELPPRFGPGGKGRGAAVLGDVEHAAWAKAVLAAIDAPPAEVASSTDPELPVVAPATDPHLPVVAAAPAPAKPADEKAPEAEPTAEEPTAEAEAEPVAEVEPVAEAEPVKDVEPVEQTEVQVETSEQAETPDVEEGVEQATADDEAESADAEATAATAEDGAADGAADVTDPEVAATTATATTATATEGGAAAPTAGSAETKAGDAEGTGAAAATAPAGDRH